MSILDDLKKQAEEAKAEQDATEARTLQKAELVRRAVLPKLQELYRYFRELKENLDVLQPELYRGYQIEGVGEWTRLRQGDYRLYTSDNPDAVTKFTFQYGFRGGPRPCEVRVDSRTDARRQREYMWKANLRFTSRDSGDGTTIFVVEYYVPLVFEFEADLDRAAVKMRVKNLSELGGMVHLFHPDRVDKDFMEEIAKFVLQKPNRLVQLTGNVLSDTSKLRLRKQIEEEKRRLELESNQAMEAARKASLAKRFSRTFFGKK